MRGSVPYSDLCDIRYLSHAVIFRVALDEDLLSVTAHYKKYSCLFGLCQNDQLRMLLNIFPAHFCVTGMRCQERIIKTSH